MTESGSEHVFFYDDAVNRITAGLQYFIVVEATIEASTRSDGQPVSRDSA